MTQASLAIVGTGIKLISHLTVETKAYIEQADKVLYLVNEPLVKESLHKLNKASESLDNIYLQHESRRDAYSAITEHILSELSKGIRLCVVIYGHPTIFAQPALDAAIKAKEQKIETTVLPGISAEDCLFADLLINPGSHGCLSLEATDLLIYQRQIDITCHVILWQISVIGMSNHETNFDNRKGLKLLADYLGKYYNNEHIVISYSAAQYPTFEPIINRLPLKQLASTSFTRTSTLYIPPAKKLRCDLATLSALGMEHD